MTKLIQYYETKLLTYKPKGQAMTKEGNVRMMRDAKGDLIPARYVSAYDKLRDRNVNRIMKRAFALRLDLETFVKTSLELLNGVSAAASKHGVRGNFSISSFDGLQRVTIRQKYVIFLDERVIAARDKMFSYVESLLRSVKADDAKALMIILKEAFKVGTNNMLSTSRVLALIKMDIKNKDWQEAQDLLKAALQPQKGKRYLQLEFRPDRNHDYKGVRLDIADCWPIGFDIDLSQQPQ